MRVKIFAFALFVAAGLGARSEAAQASLLHLPPGSAIYGGSGVAGGGAGPSGGDHDGGHHGGGGGGGGGGGAGSRGGQDSGAGEPLRGPLDDGGDGTHDADQAGGSDPGDSGSQDEIALNGDSHEGASQGNDSQEGGDQTGEGGSQSGDTDFPIPGLGDHDISSFPSSGQPGDNFPPGGGGDIQGGRQPVNVPEPSGMALLAVGLMSYAALRRRKVRRIAK